MIDGKNFYQFLTENELDHFFGVPDSVLKDFTCFFENNNILSNEGSAIASACGYYLSTQKIPVVYLQNSGLGNTINPLTAIAQNYQLPLLMFIGWRGEGEDEPQHRVMGKSSAKIMEAIGIQCEVLSIEEDKARAQIIAAIERMKSNYEPFSFLIRKKTFKPQKIEIKNSFTINRFKFLDELLEKADPESIFFSSVGFVGRELYALMKEKNLNPNKFFFGTGGMGHINTLACEFAKHDQRPVYCLDGDGSLAMHMGNLLSLAHETPKNMKYIVFNNESHLSVSGGETSWQKQSITKVLKSLKIKTVDSLEELLIAKSFAALDVQCSTDTPENLPRPSETALELAQNFLGSDHGFKPIKTTL